MCSRASDHKEAPSGGGMLMLATGCWLYNGKPRGTRKKHVTWLSQSRQKTPSGRETGGRTLSFSPLPVYYLLPYLVVLCCPEISCEEHTVSHIKGLLRGESWRVTLTTQGKSLARMMISRVPSTCANCSDTEVPTRESGEDWAPSELWRRAMVTWRMVHIVFLTKTQPTR